MRILRFLFEIDASWQAVVTCPAAGAEWRVPRGLRRLVHSDGRAFPFPPTDEMPAPGDPEAAICTDQDLLRLDETYRRIANRKPLNVPASDIELFGRYLFRTIVGKDLWQAILQAADQEQAESIELALSWAAGDHDLHRLNWEMMHGPAAFLAAGRREAGKVVPVNIVRVVSGSAEIPRPLSLPPRVLFVVYSDVADEKLRPAAEIMGLIDRLEREGRGFHREVLRNANASLVSSRVKAFRPDVVHFISHGEVDNAGRGYLLFKDQDHKQDEPLYANQILGLISAAGETPPIVVLSACKSGGGDGRTLLGGHAAVPLAAELVQLGVPIVVGMAGRIADTACRLFTLGFGAGLLSGMPLLAAIATGRCASFAEGAPPHKTGDWAFPAVFLSAAVPPDYVAAHISPDDPALRLAGWLHNLQLGRLPVFCDREEFFEAYGALLGREERRIRPTQLAIHVAKNEPGFGRTRLLQELAGQALRDGHLPLLLAYEKQDGTQPQTCLALALEVLGAADRACKVLEIPPVNPSQVLLLKRGENDVANLAQNPALDAWVSRELETAGAITNTVVKLALQADLVQLASAFRHKYPAPAGGTARVVVLLNRIELFGDKLTTALLTEWADTSGLGTPAEPVPLVFSFARGTPADHLFGQWIEDAPSNPWILERALQPFAPGEDMLAYQRVFMNPFHPNLKHGVSDVPLAISDEVNPETASIYEEMFRVNGQGMPGAFVQDKTFGIAASALKHGYLVRIQDYKWFEDILAQK
ncbi:MAG TPA: CHAT domain-containing protein [Thermoanaerobaculia bacterium]|nr:CHAT domain-containing protein [Thermoanaerobaculia bacterium]